MSRFVWVGAVFFLLPWLWVALCTTWRDEFVVVYDLVAELIGFALAQRACRTPQGDALPDRRLLAAFYGFLGVADLLFVASLGRQEFPYQRLVAETSYSAAFACLGIVLGRHVLLLEQRRITLCVATGIAAVSLALQGHFVLGPLEHSMPPFSLPIRINYFVYSGLTAWVFGCSMVLVARTLSLRHFLFLQCTILCLVSDYSLRYHAALYQYASSSEATAGWTSGVGGLGLVALWGWLANEPLWNSTVSAAPWNSLRSVVGCAAFLGNVVLLAAALMAGVLKVTTGHQLTALLAIMYAFWVSSNALALATVHKFGRAASLMPTPQQLESATRAATARYLSVPSIAQSTGLAETDALIGRYNALAEKTEMLAREKAEAHRELALASLAQQISHDIRSPLAALTLLLPELDQISEDYRVLARSAIHRVQDIANTMIATVDGSARTGEGSECLLVSAALAALVSEKRMEYRDRLRLSLDLDIAPSSFGAFADISGSELKRAISNLTNNAVEAIGETGMVRLGLFATKADVIIVIRDDGRGIPKDHLDKIYARGFTRGKKHGRGLGMTQARRAIEASGGALRIDSEEGKGTTVSLRLPRAAPPAWFMESIDLTGISSIVIVDDDPSIHGIWRERFRSHVLSGEVRLVHLQNSGQFHDFRRQHDPNGCYFLVDYDLRGSSEDGMRLLTHLDGHEGRALVTSRYEEQDVLVQCRQLGLRVIPKPNAGTIPVRRQVRGASQTRSVSTCSTS